MKSRMLWLVSCLFLTFSCFATENPHDIAKQQIVQIVETINAKQPEKMLPLLHPNVNIVLQNTQIFHTKAQWSDFLANPLLVGDVQVVGVKIKDLYVDNVYTQLDPNTLILSGTAVFGYEQSKYNKYRLPTRWLAVFHQINNEWILASFQSTADILDNPIYEQLKKQLSFISLLTFVMGIIIGLMYRRIRRKILTA